MQQLENFKLPSHDPFLILKTIKTLKKTKIVFSVIILKIQMNSHPNQLLVICKRLYYIIIIFQMMKIITEFQVHIGK